MNIFKVFALAIICFSIPSINAMNSRTIEAIDLNNLNLSTAEEPYFEFLKEYKNKDLITVCCVPEIHFRDYLPANIEFNNKEMIYYFNVMAAIALFKHVTKNPDQINIIKKMGLFSVDIYENIKNNLSSFYLFILFTAYAEIYNLNINHRQRNSICTKVHDNINKIIEKVMNNSQ